MSASPSLSRVMRMFVIISRPFSLLLFSISQKKQNPATYVFKATVVGVTLSIVKACAECSIAYIMFATLFDVYQHHKSPPNLFLVLIYSIANLLAAIHEIHAAFSQKKVVEILNDLQCFDNGLMALNTFPKNEYLSPIATGIGILTAVLWVTLTAMHQLIFVDSIILWVGFIAPYLIMCISTVHFVSLVLLLRHRFQLLNDNWQELLSYMNRLNKFRVSPASSAIIVGKPLSTDTEYRFQVLQRLRESLVKISGKVESAYSVQLLMMFSTYFAVFVQKVHRVTVVKDDTPLSLANGVYVALWLLTITLILAAVCWACSTCISHAKNTSRIMLTSELVVKDHYLRTFFEQYMMQLLHGDVNFTVCGLFSINLSLLLNMTKAMAGYIVICIQFSW